MIWLQHSFSELGQGNRYQSIGNFNSHSQIAIQRGSFLFMVVSDEPGSCGAGVARSVAASRSTPCRTLVRPAGQSAPACCCWSQSAFGAYVLASVLVGGSGVEIWREFQHLQWGCLPVSLPLGWGCCSRETWSRCWYCSFLPLEPFPASDSEAGLGL